MECVICNSGVDVIKTDVYKCKVCAHTYVNFLGDPILYHKESYRKNNFGTRGGGEIENDVFTDKFHSYRRPICEKRVTKIKNIIDECSSMFDIGAGGGTFLNTVGNLIPKKECQEVSDICAKNLTLQGYLTHKGDFCSIDIPNQYDLVTCFHVLEHIKDLDAFVDKSHAITKKYLVIEVPINRTIPPPNKNWDGHYHYFSKISIDKLFSRKFEIISIEDGVQQPSMLVVFKPI